MRDISLHVLDLIENSVRAGATVVSVTVAEEPDRDLLEIRVEDNGPGFAVPPDTAADPFYTTKAGKHTGLGLSLFGAAVGRADGTLTLSTSPLGGASVKATMRLNHVDRSPLGDLAATLSSVVFTNPQVDLRCRFRVGDREWVVRAADVARELPVGERGGLAVARKVRERIRSGLSELEVVA